MVEITGKPSIVEVNKLRSLFLEKYETTGSNPGKYHDTDLNRIRNDDRWLSDFLVQNDLNIKDSLKHLLETCEWRQKFGTNDICEENIRLDYVKCGDIFIHGRDIDDSLMIVFKSKLHTRGTQNMDDLKRCLVYWIERAFRQSNGEPLTAVFDMMNTGMSNVDMEYMRNIINIFKLYPNSLNYILVLEMPWIMNATFQIIKKLLPAKAVECLKFINLKTIKQYISEDNMLVSWGGKDTYEYKFVPEKENLVSDVGTDRKKNNIITNGVLKNSVSGLLHQATNNNVQEQNNLNLQQRKVHFANLTPNSESPMSEQSNSSFETTRDGDLLHLSPSETILFQKSTNNEFVGNVEILNVYKKPVTYKIKTTAPDKFRVRPSSGTLGPNKTATINVVLQKGHQIQPINRDKFLVMCISLADESAGAEEIANLWKNVTATSTEVEQHRLKCALPANVTTAIINNVDQDYFTEIGGEPNITAHSAHLIKNGNSLNTSSLRQSNSTQHLQSTISQLNDHVHRLESQIKFNQTLQWITIFVFLLLAIAIVYILKIEIQNSNSQYCIDK